MNTHTHTNIYTHTHTHIPASTYCTWNLSFQMASHDPYLLLVMLLCRLLPRYIWVGLCGQQNMAEMMVYEFWGQVIKLWWLLPCPLSLVTHSRGSCVARTLKRPYGKAYVARNWGLLPTASTKLPGGWVSHVESLSSSARQTNTALTDILTTISWETHGKEAGVTGTERRRREGTNWRRRQG